MKKIKVKKIWIIVSFIILIVAVVILGVQCNKKQETDLNKPSDKVEDSVGLEIADPEEADKLDEDKKVEFIVPDDENFSSEVNGQGNSNQGDNSQGDSNMGNSSDANNNDNTDDNEESTSSEDTGNLEENPDDNSQYGGFF